MPVWDPTLPQTRTGRFWVYIGDLRHPYVVYDYTPRVLRDLGYDLAVTKLKIRPGKPFVFATRRRVDLPPFVFGLPGNPVSSLVGFELFVRPALAALQAAADPGPVFEAGRLATPLRRNQARDQLVRARRTTGADGTRLAPLSGQESHMIVRAAAANALVLVPRGDGELAAGETVRYLPLPG